MTLRNYLENNKVTDKVNIDFIDSGEWIEYTWDEAHTLGEDLEFVEFEEIEIIEDSEIMLVKCNRI